MLKAGSLLHLFAPEAITKASSSSEIIQLPQNKKTEYAFISFKTPLQNNPNTVSVV